MSSIQQDQEYDPMQPFIYALKAPESQRQYPKRLRPFLDFLNMTGSINEQAKEFWLKAKENSRWVEENLMQFIRFQIQRARTGKISHSTIPNYYKAVKLFCEMNDIILNWKKIARGLPHVRDAANDRAPQLEELQKLVEYPDRRIKPIVYTMASSGIRIGSFDYLRWKHIIPIYDKDGEVVAAKIIVYAGDSEEYYSFLSPEAYLSLKNWMDFRSSFGEKIDGESWLMRDLWQTTNITYGANLGLATFPKKLKSSGVKRIIERALWEQGLRKPLTQGKRRHEWKAAHGMRKFYKTRAEQAMKPINVEITMGHDIGLSGAYYRPTEREVMQDYLKAVDLLTITNNKLKLEKELKELTVKSREIEYAIKGKLQEKEEQIAVLMRKQVKVEELLQVLLDKGQLIPILKDKN